MLYDLLKCYIHICSHTLHACVALGKVWSSQTQTNEWPALPPELQQHIYDHKHLKSVRKSPHGKTTFYTESCYIFKPVLFIKIQFTTTIDSRCFAA